jgi:predicted flap endonuclease-1-like 5' DNA nuclease
MDEMTTNIVADDLTKIEGIGEAVAEVLNQAGIMSYTDLANRSAGELKEMMNAAGPGFSFRDTSTWAQQASLAAEGRWDELQAWQAELDGGKVVAATEEE